MCTLINYIALKKRKFAPMKEEVLTKTGNEFVKAKYDYLLSNIDIFSDDANNLLPFYSISKSNLANYGYVDSILMAFDGYEYFKSAGYDYLIRSDLLLDKIYNQALFFETFKNVHNGLANKSIRSNR